VTAREAHPGLSRLQPSFREKVWGDTRLAPWFPDANRKIGEVWFESAEELPLLVKFLFTSDRLSVQVHPEDDYAAIHENSRGKTEMWHILRAGPGAAVAVGLRRQVTPEKLRELAASGEIEDHLNWIEVRPGDTIFVPAGTIHAIGAGLALCEIQQYSDVTYRLYDYNRPRELHLDRSIEVAVAAPYAPPVDVPAGFIAYCPYFAVKEWTVENEVSVSPAAGRFELFIALEGSGTIGGQEFAGGQVWYAAPDTPPFPVASLGRSRFLRAYVP
jgi:mannose-6-phosphate isomerase